MCSCKHNPPPPIKKKKSSSIDIHTLCQRLGISSVCWDMQTRSAKRTIPCNLTKLNFDLRRATCLTILKLDGHSFSFYFRSLCTLTYLLLINQIEDPNRSLMYSDRLVTGCCPLASRRWDISVRLLAAVFSACLKKGAVTSLSREAPLCNIGLGPSQDLYSLYPHVHVVKGNRNLWCFDSWTMAQRIWPLSQSRRMA